MKKSYRAAAIFTALALSLACFLCACEQVDHEKVLNEISEKNQKYNEKRRVFLDSDAYREAYAFVEDALSELFPEGEYQISLEPGDLIDADLSEFAGLSDNGEVRVKFFSEAYLSFRVDFWSFDADGQSVANELVSRGISGRMAADQYEQHYYDLDAVAKTAQYVLVPEA